MKIAGTALVGRRLIRLCASVALNKIPNFFLILSGGLPTTRMFNVNFVPAKRVLAAKVAAVALEACMLDIEKEIELLERCASECSLIANLATDYQARTENEKLANGYQHIAQSLKSALLETAGPSKFRVSSCIARFSASKSASSAVSRSMVSASMPCVSILRQRFILISSCSHLSHMGTPT